MTVEGSGAEPAGTYRPTARIGHADALAAHARRGLDAQRRRQLAPRESARTLSIARSSAACCSGVSGALGGGELLRASPPSASRRDAVEALA